MPTRMLFLICWAVAALTVVTETYGNRKTPHIDNVLGTRPVERYDFAARKRGRLRSVSPQYGYLVLSRTIPKKKLDQIANTAELSIHDLKKVHKTPDGQIHMPIFLVYCSKGIAYSLDQLAGSGFESLVYNITPVNSMDKMSHQIYRRKGFSKRQVTSDGRVYAAVTFYRNVPLVTADSLVEAYCDSVIEYSKKRLVYTVVAQPHKLYNLSQLEPIQFVTEINMHNEVLVYEGRPLIKVDSVQQFDIGQTSFPPLDTSYWVPHSSLAGEGITVGVYDTYIDSMRLDFREWRSRSAHAYSPAMSHSEMIDSSVLRRPLNGKWTNVYSNSSSHGTGVAGIIGGNGWQSPVSLTGPYGARGIAPRVSFISDRMYHPPTRPAKISNHSHVMGNYRWYEADDAEVDKGIFESGKIVVVGAGNNGFHPLHKEQVGFYSMINNAKNFITAGAIFSNMLHEGLPLRAELSSMGPTRCGRIKPDVMAPGDSHLFPLRDGAQPLVVEIDSIGIIGQNGTVKVMWDFQDSNTVWQGGNIQNVTVSNGVLRYEEIGGDAWMYSDSMQNLGALPICELYDTLLIKHKIAVPPQENYDVDSLVALFSWSVSSNPKSIGISSFKFRIDSTNFITTKVCLGEIEGIWKSQCLKSPSQRNLVRFSFSLRGVGSGGILYAVNHRNHDEYNQVYTRGAGTSQAAPHVSGVLALMLQKYKQNYLDPIGYTFNDTIAFRNSTAKAVLIHTATDLAKSTGYRGETPNPDTRGPVLYPEGPDYSTGWGMVNAKKAIDYVDTNLVREDSIDHSELVVYKFNKNEWGDCRVTLAWDDYAVAASDNFSNATQSKLINNLDLYIIDPSGRKYLPWVLDTLPQPGEMYLGDSTHFINLDGIDPILQSDIRPAYRGVDDRNNVNVVDITDAPPGEYSVVVNGTKVDYPMQPFSLVGDYSLVKDPLPLQWQHSIRTASSGDTIMVPAGDYTLCGSLNVPDSAQEVVVILQPGTILNFTEGAKEIYVGPTGKIIGAENVILSPQIILYNTPHPREPLPQDNVIGVFGTLCEAILRSELGRTTKIGPGIFNFNHVGDEGVIGVLHHDRDSSTIIRYGFDNSAPGCDYPVSKTRPGSTTLIRSIRIEINDDVFEDKVMTIYGDGVDIYENCVIEALHTDPANKSLTPVQLGSEQYPFSGTVEFRNCVFRNCGTGVKINDPMLPAQSPVFINTIFEDNDTDLHFTDGSQAFCGLESNQLRSIQVGANRYEGATAINNLVQGACTTSAGLTNMTVSDPGIVDPLVSDLRLSKRSPLIAAGTEMEDIGAQSMNTVFTFSRFLDGRIEWSNGKVVEFEDGALTVNTMGDAIVPRLTQTLNLRPVFEIRLKGNHIDNPSVVKVALNSEVIVPTLPDDYKVWDARINDVEFAKLYFCELPLNGETVEKNAIPDNTPPAPVANVNAVDESGDVVLTWNQNSEPDISRYKIFRAPVQTPLSLKQIASVPRFITEYRDAARSVNDNTYRVVAYDSTGNMSSQISGNKMYAVTGFDAFISDTLRISPAGITVQISNPDYLHGAMFTVRNKGQNDSLIVEWYGVMDQSLSNCQNRSADIFGNGAQINNIATPKLGNGYMLFNLKSATDETYLVDIEVSNWRNGQGCQ